MISFYKDMFFWEFCYLLSFFFSYWLIGLNYDTIFLFFIFDLCIYLILVNIIEFSKFEFCCFKKD